MLLWPAHKIGKAKALLARGVVAMAIVVGRGIIGRKGMVPVTASYRVGEKDFKFKKDMASSKYQIGTLVGDYVRPGAALAVRSDLNEDRADRPSARECYGS